MTCLEALRNVPGHGLFAVEVFAGCERGDKVLGVEVHGRGVDDGVNVLAFEQAHGVVVGLYAGNFGFGDVAPAGVSVCDGHALDVGLLEGFVEVLHAAVAGADEADANAVVGAERAHGGHGGDSERALAYVAKKIAAVHEFTSENGNGWFCKLWFDPRCGFWFVLSHPFARKKAKGWGTGQL
jgi:hypothetical protein